MSLIFCFLHIHWMERRIRILSINQPLFSYCALLLALESLTFEELLNSYIFRFGVLRKASLDLLIKREKLEGIDFLINFRLPRRSSKFCHRLTKAAWEYYSISEPLGLEEHLWKSCFRVPTLGWRVRKKNLQQKIFHALLLECGAQTHVCENSFRSREPMKQKISVISSRISYEGTFFSSWY